MTIVYLAVAAVAGFITGVLVGRANRNTVNTVVADATKVAGTVVSDVKKL